MARKAIGDIAAARLGADELARNFDDVAPPLDRQNALIESQRCYYCYDAPCIAACPTGIDIPNFIRRITTDNLRGAATDILSANIFGGSCARVCPTEILCEQSCVRNKDEEKPVVIGKLQRYATDWVYREHAQLFERAPDSGRHVAVVGAGPAGLSCAHRLAQLGHRVTVYEARPKPGGLNEYGIAAYKVPGFAQQEIEWLLSIGGITLNYGQSLGREISLTELRRSHDAVFVGIGLGGVNALALEGENLPGVRNAVDFIAELRQAATPAAVPVGRRVVVIGGGNTAIDAAIQSRRLGAESVTLVYRRGPESMGATPHEQEFAKSEGVSVIHWARPLRFIARDGRLGVVEFEYTQNDASGKLVGSGDRFTIEADWALKAIGQVLMPDPVRQGNAESLDLRNGRIVVDQRFATSLPGVWAGGDCVGVKLDLTVQAVEDGKRAALAIDAALRQGASHG